MSRLESDLVGLGDVNPNHLKPLPTLGAAVQLAREAGSASGAQRLGAGSTDCWVRPETGAQILGETLKHTSCFCPRLPLFQQPCSADSKSPPLHRSPDPKLQALNPLAQSQGYTPKPSSLRPEPSSLELCVQTSASSPDPEQCWPLFLRHKGGGGSLLPLLC